MKEVKISLFVDSIIVYISNSKSSTEKLLQRISTFRKVAGYKIKSQKLVDINDNLEINQRLRKKPGKQYPSQ